MGVAGIVRNKACPTPTPTSPRLLPLKIQHPPGIKTGVMLMFLFTWSLLMLTFVTAMYYWSSCRRPPKPSSNNIVDPKAHFGSTLPTTVAEYWNKRPCNLKHSSEPVGTRTYFDEVEARKYFVEPHIPQFAEFSQWKDKNVLEIGCGLGTDAVNFIRAGARYSGVDISSESVALARKRLEVYGLSTQGKMGVGDAEQLSTEIQRLWGSSPEERFDLVYSFGVIHHTPHPRRVIEQIKLVLKPQGTLKIMLYSKISFKLFWIMKETGQWNLSDQVRDPLVAHNSEAQTGCPVTYTYTFDEVRELLGPDFEVENIYKDHIFKYDLDHYNAHTGYHLDGIWRDVSPETIRAFEKELGWHTMCTARYRPAAAAAVRAAG